MLAFSFETEWIFRQFLFYSDMNSIRNICTNVHKKREKNETFNYAHVRKHSKRYYSVTREKVSMRNWNRTARFMLLPVAVLFWFVGWGLLCLDSKDQTAKPKTRSFDQDNID
jgi:hypothetical protein